ncbi:hypothetical protein L1887_16525 [Cichorium endivia]|nr:hypothetical protein L1887_16525 [Cichorium endivia]
MSRVIVTIHVIDNGFHSLRSDRQWLPPRGGVEAEQCDFIVDLVQPFGFYDTQDRLRWTLRVSYEFLVLQLEFPNRIKNSRIENLFFYNSRISHSSLLSEFLCSSFSVSIFPHDFINRENFQFYQGAGVGI